MPERAASRTAVLVCQGRAAADGRVAAGRFSDPVAVELLREDERAVVEQVRAGTPPTGSDRMAYELVQACAELMAPRTVAIDDAVRAHPGTQLVILGAGLDTRSWRLPELAETVVWELDHPASQRDKRDRLGSPTPTAREVRFVPVDFASDDLDACLASAGHDARTPTTWVWEGVVPYLTRADIRATLGMVGRRSAPGSTLIVNYQSPSVRATLGRRLATTLARLGGVRPVTAGEPWLTLLTPDQLWRLALEAGFGVVADEDLGTIADRLRSGTARRTSVRTGRVAVARRPATSS